MTNIFARSNEQYLNGVVFYLKAADVILYKESTYTNKVSKEELANAFRKGILIVDDGTNIVRPDGCTLGDTYTTVFYTTVGASDKAVKTCFYSDGYVAG